MVISGSKAVFDSYVIGIGKQWGTGRRTCFGTRLCLSAHGDALIYLCICVCMYLFIYIGGVGDNEEEHERD